MNDFVGNETNCNICIEEQSLRMSQILRAAFADASDREGALNHFNHHHPLVRLHLQVKESNAAFAISSSLVEVMPAINIVIITFMMCVGLSPEKSTMIFILALTTPLFSAPLGAQTESSFIGLLVDTMILFIICSSHTMAVSPAISIFMLSVLLYPYTCTRK